MPRFRARKDAFVPDGVYGPTIVYATDYINVSGNEAVILRDDPETWEDMDALAVVEAEAKRVEAEKQAEVEHNKMIAGSAKVKGSKGNNGSGDEEV